MSANQAPIDLLGRQPFVNDVLAIIQSYAEYHLPACYAINGIWGSGKTFVLNLLHSKLTELSQSEESGFIVFRYNCWEYDYYDEPLLSIVATMQDTMDKLDNSTVKTVLGETWNEVRDTLVDVGLLLLDSVTKGIASKIANAIKDIKGNVEAKQSEARSFDKNLPIRQAVQTLRSAVKKLSSKATVVFLVDELDRCLPEYAIRVLERLHHIYVDEAPTENVQVIFSVDRGQLEHVVKQLYGDDTDSVSYLKKFISFEIRLDKGTINYQFDSRFKDYISLFEEYPSSEQQSMADTKIRLLDGYDIRSRIAMVEKADLVHRMTWKEDGLSPYYYLGVSLFLSVLNSWVRDSKNENEYFNLKADAQLGTVRFPSHDSFSYLSVILNNNTTKDGRMIFHKEHTKVIVDDSLLYGAILCAYLTVLGSPAQFPPSLQGIRTYAENAWGLFSRLQ